MGNPPSFIFFSNGAEAEKRGDSGKLFSTLFFLLGRGAGWNNPQKIFFPPGFLAGAFLKDPIPRATLPANKGGELKFFFLF